MIFQKSSYLNFKTTTEQLLIHRFSKQLKTKQSAELAISFLRVGLELPVKNYCSLPIKEKTKQGLFFKAKKDKSRDFRNGTGIAFIPINIFCSRSRHAVRFLKKTASENLINKKHIAGK